MTSPDLSRLAWRKSSRSEDNGGQCIEIATLAQGAAIRDSKNPSGGTLRVPAAGWKAFRRTTKAA